MRWPRFGTVVWLLAVLVGSLLLAGAIAAFVDLRTDFERADARAESRADDVEALRSQLIELGETPDVETPDRGETGDRGPQGERGEVGRAPTADELFAAATRYFSLNPPADQPDPDDPEIQDAEINDPEQQDAETQEDEIQDPEVDDPDPDDPETQDPEIDDPDPDSNSCPPGFSWQPLVPGNDDRLICARDPEPEVP